MLEFMPADPLPIAILHAQHSTLPRVNRLVFATDTSFYSSWSVEQWRRKSEMKDTTMPAIIMILSIPRNQRALIHRPV
jgi:hypothetical protein